MDERLKAAFRELRAHERAGAPEFEALVVEAPRRLRRPRRAWLLASGAALAAAIATVIWWPRHMEDDVATPSITQWRAPTDVLLVTPGSQWLSELPALDESVLNLETL